MKSLIISSTLLLGLAVLANANPRHMTPPNMKAVMDGCMKKLDLTEEKLRENEKTGEIGKDRSCLMACMSKEFGVLNADGDIDKEAAVKNLPRFIPEDVRTKMVDTCYQKKGADDCETARLFHDCLEEVKPRPTISPELLKVHDYCKEKLSLTDEDVMKMTQSRRESKNCYLACIGKSIGSFNEDGTLNKKGWLEKLPPHMKEEGQEVADNCEGEKGADECETAFLLEECFTKNGFMAPDFRPPHPPRRD